MRGERSERVNNLCDYTRPGNQTARGKTQECCRPAGGGGLTVAVKGPRDGMPRSGERAANARAEDPGDTATESGEFYRNGNNS